MFTLGIVEKHIFIDPLNLIMSTQGKDPITLQVGLTYSLRFMRGDKLKFLTDLFGKSYKYNFSIGIFSV